ncbi:hypothetical protein ACFL1N_14855, partial [Thermodesulfobacteriota bacterium]
RIIADKTPNMHPNINAYHLNPCIGNLLGHKVPMTGQILVTGGTPVKTADQSGMVYTQPPEVDAFQRWQKGEFLDIERLYSKKWRRALNAIPYERVLSDLALIDIDPSSCKTLEEAKFIAESVSNASGYSVDRMKLVFSVLNIPNHFHKKIFDRWGLNGCPSLKSFAPYASFIFTVEIFFYTAALSNLISKEKVSNKVDISYLFYLPFCMIFVSSDKIHRRCTPLFLRDDQMFVWGEDLKADLKRIDEYYDKVPESEKEKGLIAIAHRPPIDEDLLVASIYDRFLPKWREWPANFYPRKDDNLANHINRFTDAKPIEPHKVDFDLSEPDALVLQRRTHIKKGKWYQLPKNILDK